MREEDVAEIVPVGDENEGGASVVVGGGEIRGGAILVGPGEIHQEFGLAPGWIEGIGWGGFVIADIGEALVVHFHGDFLAAAAFDGDVPFNSAENPEEAGIVWGCGLSFFQERGGLRGEFADARGIFFAEAISEDREARTGAHFRVNERRIVHGGIGELLYGLIQILLLLLGVNCFVEAVDGAAPEGETTPVADAGDEDFVGGRGSGFFFEVGSERGVEALEGRAVAFVVGALDLGDDFDDGSAVGCSGRRGGLSGDGCGESER